MKRQFNSLRNLLITALPETFIDRSCYCNCLILTKQKRCNRYIQVNIFFSGQSEDPSLSEKPGLSGVVKDSSSEGGRRGYWKMDLLFSSSSSYFFFFLLHNCLQFMLKMYKLQYQQLVNKKYTEPHICIHRLIFFGGQSLHFVERHSHYLGIECDTNLHNFSTTIFLGC